MREVIERGRERKRSEAAKPGIGHNSRTGFNQMRDAFQWQLIADKELSTTAEVKIGVAISRLLTVRITIGAACCMRGRASTRSRRRRARAGARLGA